MAVYIEDQQVNMEETKVCPRDALFSCLLLWKNTETRSNLGKKGFLRLPPPTQNPSAREDKKNSVQELYRNQGY